MIMKVFNKGQVVIPAALRRALGIAIGDMLDVKVDKEHHALELRKVETFESEALAGSLSRYARRKKAPSRSDMHKALKRGLSGAE